MPRPTDRKEILKRLRAVVSDGGIIVGAGAGKSTVLSTVLSRVGLARLPITLITLAGIGLSAKSVEQGGTDLIIIYNSGRFRMAGRGSLAGLMPYSDANAVVVDMVCYESRAVVVSTKGGVTENI